MKHGIDYRRATASSEVCLGALDRRAAIERLEIPPFEGIDIDVEMDYVAKKLLVTRSELEEITKSPAKWYFQYRNNKKLLGLTYDLYRFGTGKKKTSNF